MNMGMLVCAAADACADKPALVDGRCTYTFAELASLSTQFATFLLSRGTQVGDRVAFCAPKNASLVVAIVGCLKAGAVYVPIDSAVPRDRLLFILNDVSPRFLVCRAPMYDSLSPDLLEPCTFLDADRLPAYFSQGTDGYALPPVANGDVAYCMYTSGSTGRPKGVMIEHESVSSFFCALPEVMPIDSECRCMNTSELFFDVHVMDLFFPLHRGATVHLSCGSPIANDLLQTIERERITHFTAVGPLMTLVSEATQFHRADLSSLVRVMTGAEVLNVATVQRWLRRVRGLSLVNGYGPTEATVICTALLIDRIEPSRTEFYPIGWPLAGTEVMLIDSERIITEPGVEGELLISGPQVMKGYWNDEKNTREKVVTVAGKRCYRSGDICRWRSDGGLDYIGRRDEQLKLSGFRIDLSEIKRVMDSTPGVREGHPVVTEHPSLGKIIAVCFTRDGDQEGVDDDHVFAQVESAVARELPYYMVPACYVLFDRLPHLPSGKTNKNQLLTAVNTSIRSHDAGVMRFVCRERELRS